MNNTPKLSFIVPVYNVAQYLRKCVDSLLAQDYNDYEIILVDDGSTDNSSQICDEYARMNELENEKISELGKPIIRVIHRENGGLSAARNSGIEVAKGEYVCFVDSDDYWEENVLGGLMAQVEREKLDVLRFNYHNVNERYEEFYPNKDPKRDVDFSESVTDGETFLNERLGPMCYAVMFILRRDLLIVDGETCSVEGNCLFTEGIYFEDVDWTPRMLVRARRVASTAKIIYNYLWREGSITLTVNIEKRRKLLNDKMKLLYGFQEQRNLVKNPKWFKWMTNNTAMGVLDSLIELPKVNRKKYIIELQAMHIFPISTKGEKMRTHRWRIRIANLSQNLYCFIMKIRKRL